MLRQRAEPEVADLERLDLAGILDSQSSILAEDLLAEASQNAAAGEARLIAHLRASSGNGFVGGEEEGLHGMGAEPKKSRR